MSDNLANNWGCVLTMFFDDNRRRSFTLIPCGERDSFSLLRCEVNATFGGRFELVKVATCGSDAQLHALVMATELDSRNCVLVACGSYVSGGNNGLQNWSTSDFEIRNGPSHIMHPRDVKSPFALERTIAMPYHIPDTIDTSLLEAYEDECINNLHLKCIYFRMNDAPVRVLMLELVLAGCGATLSDRALSRIGLVAKHHGFGIMVDECMTGGRTGTMLHTLQKPEEFIDAVSYVTMGKWMNAGLVLCSAKEAARRNAEQEIFANRTNHNFRGTSSKIDCHRALEIWKNVKGKLGNVFDRRKRVIAQLKLNEGGTWGVGGILFASLCRNDCGQGLKNRFLFVLDDVPIERFKYTRKPEWNKKNINKIIMEGVMSWVAHVPYDVLVDTDRVLQQKAIFLFLLKITTQKMLEAGSQIRKIDVPTTLFPKKFDRALAKKVAKLALEKELLDLKRLGKAKIETYILLPSLFLPWK